ncbi:hypothetical protein V1478_014407 [Vespula squamosa]|uniref:Uncharacterized protein n=1 Tax=Vespula squamosa TaxID=30214 RepID=A0ABD2A801_VESSQ
MFASSISLFFLFIPLLPQRYSIAFSSNATLPSASTLYSCSGTGAVGLFSCSISFFAGISPSSFKFTCSMLAFFGFGNISQLNFDNDSLFTVNSTSVLFFGAERLYSISAIFFLRLTISNVVLSKEDSSSDFMIEEPLSNSSVLFLFVVCESNLDSAYHKIQNNPCLQRIVKLQIFLPDMV